MSWLTFNCNKDFIYILIYWILEISFRIVFNLKEDYFQIGNNEVENEYMLVIFSNIGDLFSGFLVIYTHYSIKSINEKEKKEVKEEDNKIALIYEQPNPGTKKNFTRNLIIIAVLEFISRSNYWLAYAITGAKGTEISHILQKDMTYSLDILMRYIFSIFLLKIKIYRHHKFSLITIFIGILILISSDVILVIFILNRDSVALCFYYSLICLLKGLTLPYEHILIKQLFSENFIFPAKIQFIRGSIEMVLLIVITIILFFSFNINLNTFHFDFAKILAIIGYILTNFLKEFILLKIIYLFSVQSVSLLSISKTLGNIIYFFILVIKTVDNKDEDDFLFFTFEILGLIIILFAVLIYDENIVIHKWDLDKNVKSNIIKRMEIEMKNDDLSEEDNIIQNHTFINKIEEP